MRCVNQYHRWLPTNFAKCSGLNGHHILFGRRMNHIVIFKVGDWDSPSFAACLTSNPSRRAHLDFSRINYNINFKSKELMTTAMRKKLSLNMDLPMLYRAFEECFIFLRP